MNDEGEPPLFYLDMESGKHPDLKNESTKCDGKGMVIRR
jgi:hypothetical protein